VVILSPLSSGLLCYCNCRVVLEADEPRLLNQRTFSPVLYLVGYETEKINGSGVPDIFSSTTCP
jgi:hypothetical protein